MSQLSAEQLAFLKSQGISLSLVVDAGHLSKSAREAFMNESGHKFYYGGSPCKAAGHTLRSKAGHCIQCDTSKIAYQLRSSAAGYVYLAHSERNGFIKVGFSEVDPDGRVTWLQSSSYGGVNDWDIKRSVRILKDAGKCEFEIHGALEKWRKPIVYQKNGEAVECREIFVCPLVDAEKLFLAITRTYQ